MNEFLLITYLRSLTKRTRILLSTTFIFVLSSCWWFLFHRIILDKNYQLKTLLFQEKNNYENNQNQLIKNKDIKNQIEELRLKLKNETQDKSSLLSTIFQFFKTYSLKLEKVLEVPTKNKLKKNVELMLLGKHDAVLKTIKELTLLPIKIKNLEITCAANSKINLNLKIKL